MKAAPLGWLGIVRLGLVQTALGAIVVLTTSTMNRVVVVELALPAVVPGILVGLHYAVQMLRPRLGYGSDIGGRRTPWIIGGIAVLACGAVLAALAIALTAHQPGGGLLLAFAAFLLIGLGVGAAGTSLLVLLAQRVAAHRRGAAASIVWFMMIAGFAVTATLAGRLLDPFSTLRLVAVTAGVGAIAFVLALAALWGVEGTGARCVPDAGRAARASRAAFLAALREVWAESEARRFTVFVFVSMLAYSAQDLILEPFAGAVFGYTPGESTQLSGLQHAGVLAGMALVALAGVALPKRSASLRLFTVGGCIASAFALASLVVAGHVGPGWPLRGSVFFLGFANGAFAVAAIGSMMALASQGREQREGTRMGLWGAAQAIAFGLGGFMGTVGSDAARLVLGSPAGAYVTVFAAEALLFLWAAWLAAHVGGRRLAGKRVSVSGAAQANWAAEVRGG
jgi:BCD family chlorophyll transporter-like MFS transporter